MSSILLTDLTAGVFTLTLNRPEVLNAFNDALAAGLLEALKHAERDPAIRCVVLTGAGAGFCAGQDLAALRDREAEISFREHLLRTFNPIVARMRTLEKPIIGQLNGATAGAGLGLALACDLRYAAAGAKLRVAFNGIALAPDSGVSFFLPRLVGYARAYELAVSNAPLTAEAAAELGLVNRVFPPAELAEAVRSVAAQLAQGPTRAFGLTKRAMNKALLVSLDEALEYEAHLQEIAGRSPDHREGVAAFLEKRRPNFTGQ
ncbi:MAG: enoyl-CoA hydratase/isomerase family protein [Anaerolineales bacterium]|nr:enoyl-CoA hydratase/isomerase family protein [Anaerolineales bacterium]